MQGEAMTSPDPSKKNTVYRAEGLSEGTAKHFSNASAMLSFGGVTYTLAQVTATLAEVADLRTAAVLAQATARAKVAAETARLPSLRDFLAAYTAFVKATFGGAPDVLADFRLAPRKTPTPQTPEEKAAAKAKRTATRQARGTRGSVQKKKITGNVIGVTVTPITAPPADSPPPAASSMLATAATASEATGGTRVP
jgi:hypothetical protein